MKTFDKLWEQSEVISSKFSGDNNVSDHFFILELMKAILNLDEITNKNDNSFNQETIGKLLFLISYFSIKYNINIYPALENYINDIKSDLLEVEE